MGRKKTMKENLLTKQMPSRRCLQCSKERILNEQKLAVVPGSAFGASGEGFLRISYAYPLRALKRAVERIEAFVANL